MTVRLVSRAAAPAKHVRPRPALASAGRALYQAAMIPATYHKFIDWIGDGTGLPDTILHLHAGMAVLMIARVVTRRSLGSFIPWSVVAAAEAFNEIMDRLHFGSWRWPDTTSDIVNTLFWPTVICLGIRLRPMLHPHGRRRRAPDAAA